ncbi:hypothetical protein VTL71DRAFT_11936 [Oculimacula yallundae]|uniref:Uncharacterized protein n=1 Tax=Oculimacula yallundae TaxID=86028 RepID=A0ABR4CTA9_9HELO
MLTAPTKGGRRNFTRLCIGRTLILIGAGSERRVKYCLTIVDIQLHPWQYDGAGIGSLDDEIKAVLPSRSLKLTSRYYSADL